MMAGVPSRSAGLYHRIRFLVGDPVALVELARPEGGWHSTLILRDIEIDRARQVARADRCACPADFTPADGLSGDRETATGQAAAELLRRSGVQCVRVDRALPMIFAELLRRAGLSVECDPDWGVLERRQKDAQELEWLRAAQATTERVMERALRTIAAADVGSDGELLDAGQPLTSEAMQRRISGWLLEEDFDGPVPIVAGGPQGADCHHHGEGILRSGQPIIVDIFPRSRRTLYNGDCTRTVVHGTATAEVLAMHAAAVAAKRAACGVLKAGVSGQQVHEACKASLESHRFRVAPPSVAADPSHASVATMTHGTGHGLGLDVHEPPLLDFGGPPLLAGEVLTVEPGLYLPGVGGVRVEDMVVVTEAGFENFNRLPETLDWSA